MSWLREPDAEPIPGYRLIGPLGTGGFGEVWKCEAPGDILKAIKFVYGNLNSLDGDAYRAEQEFKALQKVKEVRHPFVLSMERIDIVEGDLAIVMELADKSLHDLLVEHQTAGRPGIPRDELLAYLRDAADGLDYINDKHLLQHLDVKPRNLFLMGDRVKVADFGLVKNLERQSSSGLMAGVTPIYAAPETFSGKFTRQSDQYSLAVVYVELLTGKRPFNGKNIRALALQHVSEPPDLSGLPAHDRAVVNQAMAKDPEKRYPNCMAFIRALYEVEPRSSDLNLGTFTSTATAQRKSAQGIKAAAAADSGQSLAVTNAQPDVACLRPTILIGVGEFGRKALMDLRCRLLDRFGDLSQVPVFRFLYVDSDPEAVHQAISEAPEVALANSQVFPLPLQPVANYRRRALEHLNDWLPREKLYSIPRSLQPQGSRSLGRLAFHDNYLRFMTRLRREMQIATHPESLAQSVSQTGLMLRDNSPQVFILASGCGGSSGLLPDLGYAIVRQQAQLHLPTDLPSVFLFCGAPGDPATPAQDLSNLHATLTELNHYCDPTTTFSAQYGPDGQSLSDTGSPFSCAYLLTMENRTPQAHRDCIAHLGNYLSHELTTAMGTRLDIERRVHVTGGTIFRSFGTHSIWFPRGLLLRVAARFVCDILIREWHEPTYDASAVEVEAICAQALSDPGLAWDELATQIEKAARASEGTPPEIVNRLLGELNEEANRSEVLSNPAAWAQRAVEQLEEWVGTRATGADDSMLRRSRFSVLYNDAAQAAASDWERRLIESVSEVMNQPGRRVAAMEEAIRRLIDFCEQASVAQAQVVGQQHDMVRSAREQLRSSLDQCRSGPGGFSRLLGVGQQRQVRQFLDQLRVFCFARMAEDSLDAGTQFFKRLRGRLEERLNDMGFCRQRLRHLQNELAEPAEALNPSARQRLSGVEEDTYSGVFQESGTVRVVLPEGANTLEEAAQHFVSQLTPELLSKLDDAIHALVLAPLGGLKQICQKSGDLAHILAGPMIDQTAAFLGDQLPTANVIEAEISTADHKGQPLSYHIQKFYHRAAPLVGARQGRGQITFLLHPGVEISREFLPEAQKVLPNLELVAGSSPTDLSFCREQGFLTPTDLEPLLTVCQRAYGEVAHSPSASPHARYDVQEWLPLNG